MLYEIDSEDEVIELQDFIDSVRIHAFIDYDGHGFYANPPQYDRSFPAVPSEIYKGRINRNFSHVVWFNK